MDLDVEKLNRTQIILLTLLVSFVTSIATGIVTVTLLDQAPPGVTQTINKVVERTVERVVPQQSAAIVTKETVVVREDDQVIKAIEKQAVSLVSVFEKSTGENGVMVSTFIGWGIVSTKDGIIATDSGLIADSGSYAITIADGTTFDIKILSQDEDLGVALIQATLPQDSKYVFTGATFGSADKLKLGQSVIAFGGKERKAVSVGVVSSMTLFQKKSESTTTTETFVGYIDTTTSPVEEARGGPLVTVLGDVVGMSAGEKGIRYVSENLILDKIAALSEVKSGN
jgi:serine protease Do